MKKDPVNVVLIFLTISALMIIKAWITGSRYHPEMAAFLTWVIHSNRRYLKKWFNAALDRFDRSSASRKGERS